MNKIEFKINKELDKEICSDYIELKIGDYDFGYDRIISIHPKLTNIAKFSQGQRKIELDQYINKYYLENKKEISDSLKKIENIWKKVEKQFFEELGVLFGVNDFYKNKIVCNISIFKCGVIDDNRDAFQIWYDINKEDVVRHIAHEILHFYYYFYCLKKGEVEVANNWDFSEIFNVVVLNTDKFQKILKMKDEGYEIHEKYFPKFTKLWEDSKNIDEYVKRIKKTKISF